MQRFTISMEDPLADAFDALIARRGYRNRSEAVRDLVRSMLEREHDAQDAAGYCVGSLSYVYDHHRRDLAERLTALQHGQHDLTVASMHVHLDHDHCLETVILRGPSTAVQGFADAVIAERGVRHGHLHRVTVEVDPSHDHHHHPQHEAATPHMHLKPVT